MKIIRHRSARRAQYSPDAPVRPPLKRALLVGIEYTRDEQLLGDSANPLRGPHKDVYDMRHLLIDCYEYLPEDIIVLVDSDDPLQTQPTRDNMIRAIKIMVDGAQPGDRFFFHYAGHTMQVENKNFSEEDDLDECIIPCDGEGRMITDNELRRHLVDPLPIGSNLVVRRFLSSSAKSLSYSISSKAIFDSCHSASLLDLEHFRCNQVYVPWMSKGKRKSDSKLNGIVRRHAVVLSRHIYQSKRVSHEDVATRRTSVEQMLFSSPDYKTLSIGRTRSMTVKSELELWYGTPSSPIERCSSPDSMWPCNGWCPPETPRDANVIALAACKDEQLSWEDADGASMTKALVEILRSDPHPPLTHLLRDVSHTLHSMYLRLHERGRIFRKQIKEVNKRREAKSLPPTYIPPHLKVEMDNFQDPQIASHQPIPRDAIWDP